MASLRKAIEELNDNIDIDEIPLQTEVWDCLGKKSLCRLLSMGQKNLPKSESTLENVLRPCAVVVPYINPLDALEAANKTSTLPAPSVNVPHAKKRVYTVLETVTKAFRSRRIMRSCRDMDTVAVVAPMNSNMERDIMDLVIAWLSSDPEGTEESLIDQLLRTSEVELDLTTDILKNLRKNGLMTIDELEEKLYFSSKDERSECANKPTSLVEFMVVKALRLLHAVPSQKWPLTVEEFCSAIKPVSKAFIMVPPARLFGMNTRRIKNRKVKDDSNGASKETAQAKQELATEPKMKTEFAIGVQPGENDIREEIPVTPRGLTGIEVSVTDPSETSEASSEAKAATADGSDDPNRLRAVGASKDLSKFFKSRLTVAVRSHSAILVPANAQEKEHIISRVAKWVNSIQTASADPPGAAAAQATSSNPPKQTVAKIQEELANMCVGKVRHLSPSSIKDLLSFSGYIDLDDMGGRVTYHLPWNRTSEELTWRQETVDAAVKSCDCRRRIREAFPRKRKQRGLNLLGARGRPWTYDMSELDLLNILTEYWGIQ